MRVFLCIIGILIVLVSGYAAFMWLTYIDDTVISGSKYGFQIGNSKEEALKVLRKKYQDDGLSLDYTVGQDYKAVFQKIDLEKEHELFFHEDRWKFYFEDPFNLIKLYFEDGVLVKVHRHRRYFELP
jgi:hypothetical protein